MKKYSAISLSSALLFLCFQGLASSQNPDHNSSLVVAEPMPSLVNPNNPWCKHLQGSWRGTEKIRGLHHCVYRAIGFISPQENSTYELVLNLFREEGTHNYCPYTHTQTLKLHCSNNLITVREKQIILDGHINVDPSQVYIKGSIANNEASIFLNQTARKG